MTTLTTPVQLSGDHPDELLLRVITPPLQTDELSLEETYEIERTKTLLKEANFKTVALQFPDDILHDAAEVSRRLQEVEGLKTYILADTSYGRYFGLRIVFELLVAASMKSPLNILMRMSWFIMEGLVFLRESVFEASDSVLLGYLSYMCLVDLTSRLIHS